MAKVFFGRVLSIATFIGAISSVPSAFADVVVQGIVGQRIGSSYAGEFTPRTSSLSGGAGADGPTYMVCIDIDNSFPSGGTVHTYTVLDSSPIVNMAASNRAVDLYNYAVDRFYDSMVLNEMDGRSGGLFSRLMWEIAEDFDGRAASLDASSGRISGTGGVWAGYEAMVGDLRANYASIADGYRSREYTVSFLEDKQNGFQSMMMLAPLSSDIPSSNVPEPGTLALSLIGGLALLHSTKYVSNSRGKDKSRAKSQTNRK